MIVVYAPEGYSSERKYVLTVVLSHFLGIHFHMETRDIKLWCLTSSESDKELLIQDSLFQTKKDEWLKQSSMPKRPLNLWHSHGMSVRIDSSEKEIPIIYGHLLENKNLFYEDTNQLHLGIDIFGSVFFMLTRYEEYVLSLRDQFDRFPGSLSLASQENFLHRPIVNEYIEILWLHIKRLWPRLNRKTRDFQTYVSHDVDVPYKYTFSGIPYIVRHISADLIKRRSFMQGLSNLRTWRQVHKGCLAADPFNTFDWLMKLSEEYNLTSAFYFITACTDHRKEGAYDIYHPIICQLLRYIYQRGHEIGLHPSYNSYLSSAQTCKEFKILQAVCEKENIQQNLWGGRQHYLRWNNPRTWQNWEDAGLTYDSTLTFADMAGFRCGTCYEFPVYNLLTRKTLKLVERPLIVMESSVLDEWYMGLKKDLSEAFNYIVSLKKTCRQYNGNFTLLWHNSRFEEPEYRNLYQQIISD